MSRRTARVSRGRTTVVAAVLVAVGSLGLTACSSDQFCQDAKKFGQDVTALKDAGNNPAAEVAVLKKLAKEAPAQIKGDYKTLYRIMTDVQNGKANGADLSQLEGASKRIQSTLNSKCKISFTLPS